MSVSEQTSISKTPRRLRRDTKMLGEIPHHLSIMDVQYKLIYKYIWGNDHNDYNTIVYTIGNDYIPFCLMQTIRMCSFILLFICCAAFFYIQVRYSFNYYTFHVLLVTAVTFLFLFVQGGK